MTEAIKAGDRVTHYKHGRGIVVRLVSRGLVEVRFEQTAEYVEQRNLKSIDRIKRVAQAKRERDHEEQKCALRNHVLSLLEK